MRPQMQAAFSLTHRPSPGSGFRSRDSSGTAGGGLNNLRGLGLNPNNGATGMANLGNGIFNAGGSAPLGSSLSQLQSGAGFGTEFLNSFGLGGGNRNGAGSATLNSLGTGTGGGSDPGAGLLNSLGVGGGTGAGTSQGMPSGVGVGASTGAATGTGIVGAGHLGGLGADLANLNNALNSLLGPSGNPSGAGGGINTDVLLSQMLTENRREMLPRDLEEIVASRLRAANPQMVLDV